MKIISFIFSFVGFHVLLYSMARADPDPLQDYCVADNRTPPTHDYFFNGVPCIDSADADASHFATSALSKPGNTRDKSNVFGSNITRATVQNLPGLNTMGLTMSRIDFDDLGLVPPHTHPRASEVVFVLNGDLLVGFVETSNNVRMQRLRPGDAFVFPKGLVHFLFNVGQAPAVAVSGFNSQNPGTQITSLATFVTRPELPDEILKAAFRINGQDIARIRKNLMEG